MVRIIAVYMGHGTSIVIRITPSFVCQRQHIYTYNPLLTAFLNENHGIKLLDNPTYLLRELCLKLISSEVRYCPKCAVEDANKNGHVYSHRIHQISVLPFCKEHYCELIVVCPVCGIAFSDAHSRIMLQLPECPNGHSLTIEKSLIEIDPFLLELHEFIEKMLNKSGSIDSAIFLQKLYGAIGNKGYVHFKGAIYKTRLLEDYIAENGENLSKIGLRRENVHKANLVTQYFNMEYFHLHPILYISLAKWLYVSSDSFLNECQAYAFPLPFGFGPWQCKNKICPSIQNEEKAIKICKRHVHEHITGVFECPVCGFTYSRRSKQGAEEDDEHFTVDSFGELWLQKVIEGFEQGKLIQEIAESVNSSDISVVKHYEIHTNKRVDKNFRYKKYDKKYNSKLIEERKEKLLQIIEKTQDLSRPQIRGSDTFTYDLLMKEDKSWMEEVLPPRKVHQLKLVNFEEIDSDMVEEVEKAVTNIYAECPNKRITFSLIVGRLERLSRNRLNSPRKSHFKKTIELILSHCESKDEYLKRIYPNILRWFQESRYLTLSVKLIQSRFKCYQVISEEIEDWLNEEVNKIPIKGV